MAPEVSPAVPRPLDTGRGFTIAELLTVLGLVALLVSLLLPLVGKVRAAAHSTECLSNLRQMAAAWTTYSVENRGRLMHYVWSSPGPRELGWNGYWPGVLDHYQVRGRALLCPAAAEAASDPQPPGYGNVTHAWTGRFAQFGSPVRLNDTTYRDASYGYNRYLTAGGGFGPNGLSNQITAARFPSDLPVFLDCADADVRPDNGHEAAPVPPPPNLRGDKITELTPDHWNFLLARHGRGVNVCMADGSARWTRLEDTYLLSWRTDWAKYRLALPAR